MASQDVYVRKDVYEADQRALIAEIKLMHNDLLQKIDEKFDTFKKEVDKKFDTFKKEIDEKFDGVNQRFDNVDQRFEGVDQRFEGINQRFEGVNQKFDGMNQRFEGMNQRFDRLERKVEVLTARVDSLDSRITDTQNFMMIGFALIGFLVAFAVFVQPLAKFFKNWFKPAVTLEQIEELINAKLENRTRPLP